MSLIKKILECLKKVPPETFFIILYSIWCTYFILNTTVYWKDSMKYYMQIRHFSVVMFSICMFFNFFVYRIYTVKKFLIHLAITGLIWTICHSLHGFSLLYLWFMLLCTVGISFKRIAKLSLLITGSQVLLILLSVACGLTENVVYPRIEQFYFKRYSFGFYDPNSFAACISQICMALVVIRWNKFGKWDNVFLISMLYVTFVLANSRTTGLVLFLLIIMTNILTKYGEKILNWVEGFSYFTLLSCPVITFILVKLYRIGNSFALAVDDLLSCRIRNVCFCMGLYPPNLFGHRVTVHQPMKVILNIYGLMVVKFGVIFTAFFIIATGFLIRKVAKKRNIPILMMIILALIQGFSESYLFMYKNITFFAYTCMLNNDDLFLDNDDKEEVLLPSGEE